MRNDLVEHLQLKPCQRLEIHGCTEEDVLEFEQTFGVILPSDYRLFLKSYAPCYSEGYMKFSMLEPSPGASADGTTIFETFYGLIKIPPNGYEISDITNDFKSTYEDVFPSDAIVIGMDPGRSQVIMSLKDFSINYFDPEYEQVYKITTDFTTFVDSLVLS